MIDSSMKLKIGAHIYTVIYKEMEEDDGLVLKNKGEIHINSLLPETERFGTLIHECLHVINIQFTHVDTEFIAQALTQLLLDNPNIMALHRHTPKQRQVIRKARKVKK